MFFSSIFCESFVINYFQNTKQMKYNSDKNFMKLFQAIILRGLLWAAVATADQSHHQSFKQVTHVTFIMMTIRPYDDQID